jgi:chemotaxis protein methyltransferase CheR
MPDTILTQFNDLIANRMGLNFPKERWADLERGVTSAAREFGYKDIDSCIRWLLSSNPSRTQIEVLASHLTVGETYFFREDKVFTTLEKHILANLIHDRRNTDRRLRIWSAGCSTGEEPYSIAMLLSKMLPDLNDWNITILATDINPLSLKKAMTGVYGKWSFRDCPEWVREGYFTKMKEGCYEISPDIKKMVTFQYHNLSENIYPSLLNNTNAMDVIFCRNVLMYFVPDKARETVQNYYKCLIDGGCLIVSPCEVSMISHPQLNSTNLKTGIIFYTKGSDSQQTYQTVNNDYPYIPSDIPPVLEMTPCQDNKPYVIEDLKIEIDEKSRDEETDKYEQASVLYKQGYYGEAERLLTKLLSEKQSESEPMTMLARIYANQGKLQEAIVWCQKAIELDKLNPSYHYLLATIMQEIGQYPEAVSSLKHAIFLNPKFVPVYFALGILSHHQGKLRESNKYLDNVLLLLKNYQQDDVLPEVELTAGRLAEIVRLTINAEGLNEAI